jgi:release factor glutamine methyltransferase
MKQAIHSIQEQLRGLYPDLEIKSLAYLTLEFVCQKNRQSLLLGKDKQLSPNERNQVEEIVADLRKFKPIQYITGETEFYGRKFKVDENVLIPRPETEELVDWIVNLFSHQASQAKLSILDIGTGSGCIAVSLAAQFPSASVYALDISEQALEIAGQNAEKNEVKIQLIRHDILEGLPDYLPEKWDVVVSNPPYITPQEKISMSENVLNYEPHQALFVPQDKPLLFYEQIAGLALHRLKSTGNLFFETGSLYGEKTVAMLKEKGYRSVELIKDISGNDRMIRAQL